ncbi:unnamed protein product [Aphanomyces euteiches]
MDVGLSKAAAKLKPLVESVVPKPVAPLGHLDVVGDEEDSRVVFVTPKVSSPWKYKLASPAEEQVAKQEYERMSAYIEEFQRRQDVRPRMHRKSPKSPSRRHMPAVHLESIDVPTRESRSSNHFLPATEEEKQAFWESMEAHRRMRKEKSRHRSLFDFNLQAADHPQMLDDRHAAWLQHQSQFQEQCAETRQQREAEFEKRMQEATSEYRNHLRNLKRQHEAHQAALRPMLPIIFAAIAAHEFTTRMRALWALQCRIVHVKRIALRWRERTQRNLACAMHATRLRHWLRESVKIKTVAHKVFYALRVYISRVVLVQSLWRRKVATRYVQLRFLEARWKVFIATPPEAPSPPSHASKEHVEKPKVKPTVKVQPARRTKNPKLVSYPYPDIDLKFQNQILVEVVREHERDCRARFRAMEVDLLPHLIQSLQGVYVDRTRTEVRQMAANHALLGSVWTRLQAIPGALDVNETPAVDFSVKHLDLLQLVTRAYQLQCEEGKAHRKA